MWKKTVPTELAKAFHKAIEKDSDDLLEVKDAVLAICDWLESIDEDLEWEVQEVRDAWDIVDIDDRYGYFDPDYDEDDYDEDETDFIDERTNEEFVNEEIISVLYDILDANDIWLSPATDFLENVTENEEAIDESFKNVTNILNGLKDKKFSENKFSIDLVESINEVQVAIEEIKDKYFEESK
jgi:hypothetical protein